MAIHGGKKALIKTLFHVSSIIHSSPVILLSNIQGLFSKFSKNRVLTKQGSSSTCVSSSHSSKKVLFLFEILKVKYNRMKSLELSSVFRAMKMTRLWNILKQNVPKIPGSCSRVCKTSDTRKMCVNPFFHEEIHSP